MEGFNEGGDLGVRRWFEDNFMRKESNGENILFCRDRWMEKEPFCVKFSKLYCLLVSKDALVVEMYRIGWESRVVVGHWKWCRRMFVWEEEHVVECCVVLENYTFVGGR
jgi:hypothetical protein